MNASRRALAAFALLLPAAIVADPAWAACSVSASTVSFGAYNRQSASPLDGTGTITVSCSGPPTPGDLAIGTGGSGSYSARRMVSGSKVISYNLYTSATRVTVWGNGSSGTGTVAIPGSGTYTVYGRIPAAQDVGAGTYTDSLVITLTY